MLVEYTPHFRRRFEKFSREVQNKFQKQIVYLLRNSRHPSLRVKKVNEHEGIWQARVDKNIRFYFKIQEDRYILLNIKKHEG